IDPGTPPTNRVLVRTAAGRWVSLSIASRRTSDEFCSFGFLSVGDFKTPKCTLRCQPHHKRGSQHGVNGCGGLRNRLHYLAYHTTADRPAVHRKSDQRRDDLCAVGLRSHPSFNEFSVPTARRPSRTHPLWWEAASPTDIQPSPAQSQIRRAAACRPYRSPSCVGP